MDLLPRAARKLLREMGQLDHPWCGRVLCPIASWVGGRLAAHALVLAGADSGGSFQTGRHQGKAAGSPGCASNRVGTPSLTGWAPRAWGQARATLVVVLHGAGVNLSCLVIKDGR